MTALLAFVGFMPSAHAGEFGVIAMPDTVHTTVDTPVNFDPTTNDTVGFDLEVVSVDIESSPQHGTATVNPDGITINYAPDAGYSGPDSMQYNVHVCSSVETGTDCVEDGSDISITVSPAAVTTTTPEPTTSTTEVSTTTVAPATTVAPTTVVTVLAQASTTTTAKVAVAATATLPRTGSSSGPLALVAVLIVGLGSLLLALGRRRNSATR